MQWLNFALRHQKSQIIKREMCGEENQLSGGQNHKAETNLTLRIGLKM